MPGISAQVPSVAPAQRAEGSSNSTLPLNSLFVAPNVWTKFSIRHPDVSYAEFLSYRAERYRLHNEAAKRFFAEFSRDPARRDAVLRDRAARRAAKRRLVDPFVAEGVVPKTEPIEEGVLGPPEYVYLIPDTSSESFAAVKVETEGSPSYGL
jgi:hypothetical protein